MPLYRRLPKRGFKNFNNQKSKTAIINISDIEKFVGIKKISITEKINLKSLQNLKLINKKYEKLKILGNGEIKNKINIEANKVSKPAKAKIESAGGTISIIN
jgi:large subunit ribosomal protein L15